MVSLNLFEHKITSIDSEKSMLVDDVIEIRDPVLRDSPDRQPA